MADKLLREVSASRLPYNAEIIKFLSKINSGSTIRIHGMIKEGVPEIVQCDIGFEPDVLSDYKALLFKLFSSNAYSKTEFRQKRFKEDRDVQVLRVHGKWFLY